MLQKNSSIYILTVVILMISCFVIVGCVHPPPPPSPPPPPDEVLQVGDKFSFIDDSEIQRSNLDVLINSTIIINGSITGGTQEFGNGWIQLKNGTEYKIPGRCIIDFSTGNGIITKGKIEVYYKK